jgi:NADPH-dependent curcumin reductase CurA
MDLAGPHQPDVDQRHAYLPPVGIGEVMRAAGMGTVVASNNPNYAVGQTVQGLLGWQEYAVLSDGALVNPVDVADGVRRAPTWARWG